MDETPLDAAGRDLKLEAEQRDADLKLVMSTPWGRRVVARLLANTKLEKRSYEGELTHATAFNEGVREMGVRLNDELKRVTFDEWLLMHQENAPPKLVHRGGDASKP